MAYEAECLVKMGNHVLNKQTRLQVVVALDKDDINYVTDLHVKLWIF